MKLQSVEHKVSGAFKQATSNGERKRLRGAALAMN